MTTTTPTTRAVAPASSWSMSTDGGDERGPVAIVGHHLLWEPFSCTVQLRGRRWGTQGGHPGPRQATIG